MMKVKSINENDFEGEVINHEGKVLVDFYSETCPPCKMMAPIVDQVAEELSDTLKIVKIDASENHSLAEKYQVNSVPAFLLIEDGVTKKSTSGVMPPAQLKRWMEV